MRLTKAFTLEAMALGGASEKHGRKEHGLKYL